MVGHSIGSALHIGARAAAAATVEVAAARRGLDMEARGAGEALVFEDWHFDRQARRLSRQAATGARTSVSVGSRALDILALLLERPGTLMSKEAIMDAVWPNAAVEANNLTVQISALRHVLDHDRTGASCIQTVPGRGYRFVVPVLLREAAPPLSQAPSPDSDDSDAAPSPEVSGTHVVTAPNAVTTADASLGSSRLARHRPGVRFAVLLAGLCLAIGGLLLFGVGHHFSLASPLAPPRLSLVVLPFENLSGDARDDYLADGITDDLTSDLSHIAVSSAIVIARESAYSYKGKHEDVRKIGRDLGVRYVIEGSVRRIDSTLRINVSLTSAETGAELWSDRFDEQISELAAGQEQIVARMRAGLGMSVVDIESARSLRERPTHPDAFDLVLRARSLQHLPPSPQQYDETRALYERALSLDPSSVPALVGFGLLLSKRFEGGNWGTAENMQRAEKLLMQARAIAPESEGVLNLTTQWFQKLDRYQEADAAAEEFIRRFPNNEAGYYDLAQVKTVTGHADEAIALEEQAIRLDPRSPWMYARYRDMGFAALLLGKDLDAITFLERSLASTPDGAVDLRWVYRCLAVAYARTGQMLRAKHALTEADRLWPYYTVRMLSPRDPSSAVYVEQIKHFQDGLRLAGERDHADEDADFGVPADATLHSQFAGLTPTSAPGTKTIRTADLVRFLVAARPVVIDTVSYSWGRSIPGAVGLKHAGLGGSFTDAAQDRLRHEMHELTAGDRNQPIIAVGWNSERFDGRNLALRLVALGYTQVYWYRGGREAWEAADLPEADLAMEEW
jgi:adenylate cyclase